MSGKTLANAVFLFGTKPALTHGQAKDIMGPRGVGSQI
jgi:hypothetical protein